MFNFKTIFAGAIIATSILCVADAVTPQKADAATVCRSGAGWEACTQTGALHDTVVLNYGGRFENLNIRCNNAGMAFQSTGQLTKAEAQEFAEGYCLTRGYNAHM